MILRTPIQHQSDLRAKITAAYRMDEKTLLEQLLPQISFDAQQKSHIEHVARMLVTDVRNTRKKKGGMDAFMDKYDLSSEEGVALMCLAEALLRIPDKATQDSLIIDKLTSANWETHLGTSDSLFVNASTWGLMLTGEILQSVKEHTNGIGSSLKRWLHKTSKPVIRKAVYEAMKVVGQQFVMGETIEKAIKRAHDGEKQGYRYSFDMLGEAAHTAADAQRYLKAYEDAIDSVAKHYKKNNLFDSAGISIKLSALHPRYELAQRERCVPVLTDRLLKLALQAKAANINLTVDAEEAERLDISLDIFEAVYRNPLLNGWEGFGLAIQGYQKRCTFLIDWLIDLSKQVGRRMMVRLVKGAYWDTDIKHSQVEGLEGYAVFTRKYSTDLAYLVCAKKLIDAQAEIYPQFATHNANTVAHILEMVSDRRDFEFQCLQGMGQPLYDQIVGSEKMGIPARIYAPVGIHEDLLPYLVRRLLENGANTSFVNRIVDENVPIEDMLVSPIDRVKSYHCEPHPQIPLPRNIYPDNRINSSGIDFSNIDRINTLDKALDQFQTTHYQAKVLHKKKDLGDGVKVTEPRDRRLIVGTVYEATSEDCDLAINRATQAFELWCGLPVETRAGFLNKIADLYEENEAELMALTMREAGKTVLDALSEVREAVDFCRYYAIEAEKAFQPIAMPGPTGESNMLTLHGRGPLLCISPWNFPLAIFTGQIVSSLVTGNTVIAKPAEQTSLIAARAVSLMHEAGVPEDVIQLLPGKGSVIGAKLVADPAIKGVLFTGSTETARLINQSLATREGPITPLIAETGGQNCMIVDSTALPEQVIQDTIQSAFGSAGQRCSALRVLYLQDDIADHTIEMLKGAIAELSIDDSALLATDIGPVIDDEARDMLLKHADYLAQHAKLIAEAPLAEACRHGTYFAPRAYEIESISQLKREVFGPILHVIRYKRRDLDRIIDSINSSGYGLTFGMHTRITHAINIITPKLHVGNTYVNRSTIGAVVGVQPFGGEGLSGTGPKAGGPHFLRRLCHERTLTVNTTATGGNTQLMSLQDSFDD